MTRCAVLGTPVQHSLSPTMHRAAYRQLGLEWTYEAIEVVPEGLRAFLDDLDESWRGLSLTMPLKRTVVPLLDGLDEHARRSRAANTVLLTGERRLGFNTDVPGAATALAAHLHDPVDSVVVLGGGATATSVLLALADRGCKEARIVVRDPARAAETVATVSAHPTPPDLEVVAFEQLGSVDCDLVVSTIPPAAQTSQVVAACAAVPAVFDVVYDPWPTPLAQAARDSRRTFISGIELLGYQAELQVQIMTGRPVDAGVLIAAATEELERRVVENGPRGLQAP